jgi:hypothetical protein
MNSANNTNTILATTQEIIISGQCNDAFLFATVEGTCNIKEIGVEVFGAEMAITVDKLCRYTGELLCSSVYRMPVSDSFEHAGQTIQIPQVWSMLYWIAEERRAA